MLTYAKGFCSFGTVNRLFFSFLFFGLICPLKLISFSLLNSGMDQELSDQGKFKELTVLLGIVCLYFMVYLVLLEQGKGDPFPATNVVHA